MPDLGWDLASIGLYWVIASFVAALLLAQVLRH